MSTIIEERPTVSQTTPYGLGVTVALPYASTVALSYARKYGRSGASTKSGPCLWAS